MTLKNHVKLPMVMFSWSTAIFSGMNLCILKCFGEILAQNDFWNMPVMATVLLTSVLVGAAMQIIVLNVALRYYNNLDIIPVYMSLILIMMLVCGWILLDEIQFYTKSEIIGILFSSLLVIIGIKIITMKTTVIATLKKRN